MEVIETSLIKRGWGILGGSLELCNSEVGSSVLFVEIVDYLLLIWLSWLTRSRCLI